MNSILHPTSSKRFTLTMQLVLLACWLFLVGALTSGLSTPGRSGTARASASGTTAVTQDAAGPVKASGRNWSDYWLEVGAALGAN
jgi:hypothetical protein